MPANWTTPVAITGSSVLPFGHWNTYIRDNLDFLFEELTGLSAVSYNHRNRATGVHGQIQKASLLSTFNESFSSGWGIQAKFLPDIAPATPTWFEWPTGFSAINGSDSAYNVFATISGTGTGYSLRIVALKPASAQLVIDSGVDGSVGSIYALGFGVINGP